jgi:predicted MPP superfamily phosphohydrolase
LAVTLFSCRTIKVPLYELESPKAAAAGPVKIILIADLHSTIYGKDQSPLIKLVRENKPDLILLAGDIIDDKRPILGASLFLEGIRGLAPSFYVYGNHEYLIADRRIVWNEMRKYGVTILQDSYQEIEIRGNKFIIAGVKDQETALLVDPAYDQELSMEKALRKLDSMEGFKILLAHEPQYIERYRKYSFDLVVSGHAHGGQVRFPPWMSGLYAPGQGFFPKYAGGLYSYGSLTHIVSRGLSVYTGTPRIFNPPELVVITVGTEKIEK